MNIFEITIQRKHGDHWPVVVEQSDGELAIPVRTEGSLALDLVSLDVGPKAGYGETLGRAVFRDEIRSAFDRARARGEDLLHVLLFVEAADLSTLRWERLAAPVGG